MTRIKLDKRRPWRGAARLAVSSLVIVGAGSVFGCLDRPIAPNGPRTTSTIVERLSQSAVDKIDILLAIDNSRSMADKQAILAAAVPDLVKGLVNPRCIDPKGMAPAQTPNKPTDDCPMGMKREFTPVADIHIGIISSSIGGHGADACTAADGPSNVDMAHLLARTDASNGMNNIPTYKNKGFLAWDPLQKIAGQPKVSDPGDGEADIDADSTADADMTALVPVLTDMVKGVGQVGCGFEAQLESWYRFLVDPAPYEKIEVKDNKATVSGIDTTLIQQRTDFLRPNSLLAIIMLSDENDCSIREEGVGFFAAQRRTGSGGAFHLWKPRSECANDPNDPCCKSCNQAAGSCPPDPNCGSDPNNPATLSDVEDQINLRCFDQKRRFGFDFLYPIERYQQALTSTTIQNRQGELVANPIFDDLDKTDDLTNVRDAGLVFFAGIVGVPWQNIARDPMDLTKGIKNSEELKAPVSGDLTTWDIILGDPATGTRPADPHMIESIAPRSGTNPITGTQIQPPNSTTRDEINGSEWTISAQDDLQYACIFDLPQSDVRDCADASQMGASCDCEDANNDNPLCDNGRDGRSLQTRAKAYPGLRELSVIKSVGSQGIVGSVCPKEIDNTNAADYGYRPAIGAIIDRLKTALGGQCLPRTLKPDENGQVSCLILEARRAEGTCDCNAAARQDVTEDHQAAKAAALADPVAKDAKFDCVCEVKQLSGDEGDKCRDEADENAVALNGKPIDGWCYVDGTTSPPTGNPEIVKDCPATERRLIRFVNKGEAQPSATLFITCSGE